MRVALLTSPPGSPLYSALSPMLGEWEAVGIEVTVLFPPFAPQLDLINDHDVVHTGWGKLADITSIIPPLTTNVWHVTLDKVNIMKAVLGNYFHMIADSPTTIAILAQMGYYANVSYAPMVVDTAALPLLPLPKDFTVGILCAEEPIRRWGVVREGAHIAGVECYQLTFRPTRQVQHIALVEDFYRHISCYVHPSFHCTDPMTIHEAMACGRPAISTCISGPYAYIKEGINGAFFDGSPKDLARAIIKVRDTLGVLREGVEGTAFPTPRDAAPAYVAMWQRAVEATR